MTSVSHIIVNDERIPCAAPVRLWTETGLHFPNLVKRLRTQFVVTHWTGAENPPHRVFENMLNAQPYPLSVHFVIDVPGVIWQMCDASSFCAHAKGVNDRSVGIEIVNIGSGLGPDKKTPQQRELVAERINGQLVAYAAFLPQQVASCLELVTSLCGAYELPMQVPTKGGEVYPAKLPAPNLARFRGVLGHLNTKEDKPDPGLRLLRAIHARGSAQSNLRA